MPRDRAVEALAALLRGDKVECCGVLRSLTVAQRTALADGCHLLIAEIGRANLEEGTPAAAAAPPRKPV